MSADWSEDEQKQLRERAQGRGEADPAYLNEQQRQAPEPIRILQQPDSTALRLDIEPSRRTIINMQRDRRVIE